MKTLLPHQILAYDYCAKTQHPYLAMEMRLGKTLVAVRFLRNKYPGSKILVIAPMTVLEAWERELVDEGQYYHVLDASRTTGMDFVKDIEGCWYLINYDALRNRPWVYQMDWQAVVLDESTVARNPKAEITKVLTNNFRKVPTRLCLSGNPAPEGILDWFSQAKFLWDGLLACRNFWDFRNKFFACAGFDWVPMKGSFERIMFALKGSVFFLTRKQAGLGNRRIFERRTVKLPEALRKNYNEMEKSFATEIGDEHVETVWATVRSVHLAKMAGGWKGTYDHKVREVLNLIQGELKGEQVVIWFRFIAEIDSVAGALADVGVAFRRITGADSYEDRKASIQMFRQGAARVVLCQLRAARFGTDLSTSSTAIFFSNEYSSEVRSQAIERIENITKNEPLLILDLVAENTVDEDCLDALLEKSADSKVFFSRMLDAFKERREKWVTTRSTEAT